MWQQFKSLYLGEDHEEDNEDNEDTVATRNDDTYLRVKQKL